MLYSPLIFCFENTENFTPLSWLCVLVHRRRELAVLSVVFSLNAEIGWRHRATQWFTLLTLRINHVRAIKETVGLVLGCFMLTAVHNTLSWMHTEDIIMCHNHKRNKNREFSVQRQQPQILIFHPEKQCLAPDWATKPFTCFFPSANQHIAHKAPLKTSIKWLIITNLWIAGHAALQLLNLHTLLCLRTTAPRDLCECRWAVMHWFLVLSGREYIQILSAEEGRTGNQLFSETSSCVLHSPRALQNGLGVCPCSTPYCSAKWVSLNVAHPCFEPRAQWTHLEEI